MKCPYATVFDPFRGRCNWDILVKVWNRTKNYQSTWYNEFDCDINNKDSFWCWYNLWNYCQDWYSISDLPLWWTRSISWICTDDNDSSNSITCGTSCLDPEFVYNPDIKECVKRPPPSCWLVEGTCTPWIPENYKSTDSLYIRECSMLWYTNIKCNLPKPEDPWNWKVTPDKPWSIQDPKCVSACKHAGIGPRWGGIVTAYPDDCRLFCNCETFTKRICLWWTFFDEVKDICEWENKVDCWSRPRWILQWWS